MSHLKYFLFFFVMFITSCRADQDTVSVFPLDRYSQIISDWINPNDANDNKVLLNPDLQQKRFANLYKHIYGESSPWSAEYINKILRHAAPDDLKTLEQSLITNFSNQNKPDNQIGYGENFRPHTQEWIDAIAENINFSQFESLRYDPNQQGIAVDNAHARALPTNDVHFYNHNLAGQGYPFDNLQMSALWAGTPVYILGETRDHAWLMIVTPDYIAWVNSNSIARANSAFINTWQLAAKKQLAAITHTQTSILDQQHNYHFSAYVGSLFPAVEAEQGYKIMIPVANQLHQAEVNFAAVSKEQASIIPIPATQHNFATLMSTLIGRPYGWGNMYFYNDCSAELKSLFTPFGVWLPRHSSDQVTVGKMVDKTSSSTEERLNYLMENGHRFMTLVYIGGHIILYIGNYPNPNNKDHTLMAMTYQNLWGLSPKPPIRRAVIGKSVLLPMLLQYPEDTNLASLASKSFFQVSYIDDASTDNLNKLEMIDLRSLMLPW